MVLLYEEIVVFLYNDVLPAYKFCLFEGVEKVVVEVGSLLNQFEFGGVAVSHPAVQLPLQQKHDQKPVDPYYSVVRTLVEEQADGHNDGERSLEDHVHVFEQIEYQLQIHVLQLNYLGIRNTVPALLRYPQ